MPIAHSTRLFVQRRANFSCEYCGVSEVDSGGELTIDHFQPRSQGGADEQNNLIYSCVRCNQYKRDYWPQKEQQALWNPRLEPASQHFIVTDNGLLQPLTAKGAFTIQFLRLNRRHLIAHRHQKQQVATQARLLQQLYDIMQSYEHLTAQQTKLIEEQRRLLDEQARFLRHFLD